jgi:hypothetical protein
MLNTAWRSYKCMKTEEQIVEEVADRLAGKRVRVTYYAQETVYYTTVIEANTREQADNQYYGGEVEATQTDSDHWETTEIEEEEI